MDGKLIMYGELERTRTEVVMFYFRVLPWPKQFHVFRGHYKSHICILQY